MFSPTISKCDIDFSLVNSFCMCLIITIIVNFITYNNEDDDDDDCDK